MSALRRVQRAVDQRIAEIESTILNGAGSWEGYIREVVERSAFLDVRRFINEEIARGDLEAEDFDDDDGTRYANPV